MVVTMAACSFWVKRGGDHRYAGTQPLLGQPHYSGGPSPLPFDSHGQSAPPTVLHCFDRCQSYRGPDTALDFADCWLPLTVAAILLVFDSIWYSLGAAFSSTFYCFIGMGFTLVCILPYPTQNYGSHSDLSIEIIIFKLGFVGDIDLNRIVRLVSISPEIIKVRISDPIPNLGDPDIHGLGYSDECLFSLFPRRGENVIRAGIILAPIQGNFFTRTKNYDSIIISLFQRQEICNEAGRTLEESIALALTTEILSLQFLACKSEASYLDLFHQDTRGCIFDFVGHKPDMVYKLRAAQIDTICKGKLVEANVPETIVKTTEQILARIRKPSFLDTFRMGLQNSTFSFFFGGLFVSLVVNLLSSLFLEEFDSATDFYVLGALLLLIVAMVIGNYVWILHKSRKTKVY